MNFYQRIHTSLLELKPHLHKELSEREMEVRKREKNSYQVYWGKRVERNFAVIQISLESILHDYDQFQDSIGKSVYEYLSLSEEKEVKSILNLFRKDVWFEKDVLSKFAKKDGKFYRFFKDDLQDDVFVQDVTEEEAKRAMMNKCREELIHSYYTKFEYIENYLKKEMNKLEKILSQVKKSKSKSSDFYNYGLEIIDDQPTIALVLLGIAIECHLKQSYHSIIRESISLGKIIGVLKKRGRMRKTIPLLEEINDSYVKAKHEKDTLFSSEQVNQYYQTAAMIFLKK